MSFDFFGVPTPAIPATAIGELLRGIASVVGYSIIREAGTEIGLVANDAKDLAPETITIQLHCDRVYVGFHAATGSERDRVIEAVENCLRQKGYECDLQEE
jgi:hypothetical protein